MTKSVKELHKIFDQLKEEYVLFIAHVFYIDFDKKLSSFQLLNIEQFKKCIVYRVSNRETVRNIRHT